MDKFWLVWAPGRSPPMVTHSSEYLAKVEAVRLAIDHPGINFVVLESLGEYRKDEPLWHPHTLRKMGG